MTTRETVNAAFGELEAVVNGEADASSLSRSAKMLLCLNGPVFEAGKRRWEKHREHGRQATLAEEVNTLRRLLRECVAAMDAHEIEPSHEARELAGRPWRSA